MGNEGAGYPSDIAGSVFVATYRGALPEDSPQREGGSLYALVRSFGGRSGEPCNPRLDLTRGQATIEPSHTKDQRCTRLWIRWVNLSGLICEVG
jgi:hypothetical protein